MILDKDDYITEAQSHIFNIDIIGYLMAQCA